jgi:DNA-binding MurR/RpiR family transcriptional regulator
MAMDVLKRISEKMPLLTAKQQKVSKYILENWEKASFESAITIAKKLNMSQSSVIRTTNALGFKGVPHLQAELRDYIQTHISTVGRIERVSRMQKNDNSETIIGSVIKQSGENIRGTLQALNASKIDEFIRTIKKARNIHILGMRSSASLAQYLGFNLNLLLGNVTVLDSNFGLCERVRSLTAADVLISISFSRYTRLTVEVTRMAREREVTIIGITDSMAAPIAGLCDVVVVARTESMHLNNSCASVMAAFDVLLTALLLSDKPKYLKEVEKLEEGFQRLNIFESA